VIRLREIHPALYITLLIAVMVGTYLVKLRTQGIFACTAEGYYAANHAYLGYCDASAYGDYDHGAFWLNLEPDVRRFAANADVLFLGSSRMQFAFSTQATDKWFAGANARDYLMGFSHTENETFTGPLLASLRPHAKAYVINVDQFFFDRETDPGADLLHERNDVARRYREKKLWQHWHRMICTRIRAVCGHKFAYYRTPETGHWKTRGKQKNDTSFTADGPISDQAQWSHYAALANQFVASLPVDRSCVFLTVVPYPGTRHAEAQAIAAAIGMRLIDPQVSGLRTFDGSHLDPSSAERWSAAFYDIAGPKLQRCLGAPTASPVAMR
jgi:hypothetical protein